MSKSDYVSNNSFMTSQVKAPTAIPTVFGGEYVDPLEAAKQEKEARDRKDKKEVKNEVKQKESKFPENTGETQDFTYSPTYSPTADPTYGHTYSSGNTPTADPTILPTAQTEDEKQVISHLPASIKKNWGKFPKSVRDWISKGVFINSSLPIYIVILEHTLWAIPPRRKAQISKPQLLKGSGVKTDRALLKNIQYLKNIKLIKPTVLKGNHRGNVFEIFTPDEVGDAHLLSYLPSYSPTYDPNAVLPLEQQVPTVFKAVGSSDGSLTGTGSNADRKTLFKETVKTDDENALADFLPVLSDASRSVLGKDLNPRQRADWKKLAELLALEFERAEELAENPVSNMAAFLTHHIAAQLHRARRIAEKKGSEKPQKIKPADVGKTPEQLVDEPVQLMTAKERNEKLEWLRESKEQGTVPYREFQSYGEIEYHPEDYSWLKSELEKVDESVKKR